MTHDTARISAEEVAELERLHADASLLSCAAIHGALPRLLADRKAADAALAASKAEVGALREAARGSIEALDYLVEQRNAQLSNRGWNPSRAHIEDDRNRVFGVASVLRDALSAKAEPAAGDRWRLVPVKPTEAMVIAAMNTLPGPVDICEADIEDIYETMTAAAPPAPASDKEAGEDDCVCGGGQISGHARTCPYDEDRWREADDFYDAGGKG